MTFTVLSRRSYPSADERERRNFEVICEKWLIKHRPGSSPYCRRIFSIKGYCSFIPLSTALKKIEVVFLGKAENPQQAKEIAIEKIKAIESKFEKDLEKWRQGGCQGGYHFLPNFDSLNVCGFDNEGNCHFMLQTSVDSFCDGHGWKPVGYSEKEYAVC